MKYKILTVILFTLIFTSGIAQKQSKNKCKLTVDKETGRELYEITDTYPSFADTSISDTLFITENFKFKVSSKNHNNNEWVQFAYVIEANGKPTFLKLITQNGDKEVEEEAKRIVSIMPTYTPAMCGDKAVPTRINIKFKMSTN